jgi:hypothetical protein
MTIIKMVCCQFSWFNARPPRHGEAASVTLGNLHYETPTVSIKLNRQKINAF